MLKLITKKYAFFASCALLSLLLLILSGCDATSDPRVYYQATGSWEGTIGADRVKGIVSPDGSYHLALVDATGAFHSEGGEYIGKIGSINPDNIGSMSLARLQSGVSSGPLPTVTFILSANQLRSDQGIVLTRTLEANGPALQENIAGHWSLLAADNTTEVVIASDGTLNGNDGFCKYSGSLTIQQPPAWNIYSLSLTIANNTYRSCPTEKRGIYSGLAMRVDTGDPRPLLWLAANSGSKTYLGEWSETENVAPVAAFAIIGEREDQTVQVQKSNLIVELDAQLSSDANNDSLTYTWSVTGPGGPIEITAAGSAATFVPLIDPDDSNLELSYSITLTVDDGIASDTVTRAIRVVWLAPRFIDCKNGTVLDNSPSWDPVDTVPDPTIKLIWLKNAGCPDLHGLLPEQLWWVNQATATANVDSLTAPSCGLLIDETPDTPWRLPSRAEFKSIMAPTSTPPTLVVGGLFENVGTHPYAPYKVWLYWTSELVEGDATLGYYADFANYINRIGSMSVDNKNAVWPVRTASDDEVSACLSAP